jgi:hypothetical protein
LRVYHWLSEATSRLRQLRCHPSSLCRRHRRPPKKSKAAHTQAHRDPKQERETRLTTHASPTWTKETANNQRETPGSRGTYGRIRLRHKHTIHHGTRKHGSVVIAVLWRHGPFNHGTDVELPAEGRSHIWHVLYRLQTHTDAIKTGRGAANTRHTQHHEEGTQFQQFCVRGVLEPAFDGNTVINLWDANGNSGCTSSTRPCNDSPQPPT